MIIIVRSSIFASMDTVSAEGTKVGIKFRGKTIRLEVIVT